MKDVRAKGPSKISESICPKFFSTSFTLYRASIFPEYVVDIVVEIDLVETETTDPKFSEEEIEINWDLPVTFAMMKDPYKMTCK